MKKVSLLDCTLRDGGYYNDWDFPASLAEDVVAAVSASGTSIMEVGYKSPVRDRFYGLFKYCPESQLKFLKKYPSLSYAFMVDTKEFLSADGKFDEAEFRRYILPSERSMFRWCRVASAFGNLAESARFIQALSQRGYQTTFNLMGLSLLSDAQVRECLSVMKDTPMDVFYFADSFGSLVPQDIRRIVGLIRETYDGPIGIHTHENQGLAFANTLAAIEAGVEYVDGTISGMGRGAGNLRLEQILLAMYFKYDRRDLNGYALLDVIQRYFQPMKDTYHWGWDFSYMLSGVLDIHPSYCQKLKSNHQYTMVQVAEILRSIPKPSRPKFNPGELEATCNRILSCKEETNHEKNPLPAYQPPSADTVLILGAGPSAKAHQSSIRDFIRIHSPLVLECNRTGLVEDLTRYTVILNEARFQEAFARKFALSPQAVITAESSHRGFSTDGVVGLECEISAGRFSVEPGGKVVIPGYIVGMFAVGIALLSKPKRIYLAGFDGYSDPQHRDEQNEMQAFWDLCQNSSLAAGCEVVSLLPTAYAMPQQSIYSLLD